MKVIKALLFLGILMIASLPRLGAAMGTSHLTIETVDGRSLPFTIELAQTAEEQSLGLMNRRSLAPDAGMLFDFGPERPIAMWMKNTLIPLDMIFISADGRILGIAERTVPLSLETIGSPGSIKAVLEVNGGTADRLHIHSGDRVSHPIFGH
jgi:uncharacterized membrane protein (UPF0127 family)